MVVNVINQTGGIPEQMQATPAKRKKRPGNSFFSVSVPQLMLLLALIGSMVYLFWGHLKAPLQAVNVFKKSPQELALGRWQFRDDRNPAEIMTIVFYRDGVAEWILPSQMPVKGSYKFVDDSNLEVVGPRGSFRLQVTFPTEDEFVWIFPDGKRHSLTRVK